MNLSANYYHRLTRMPNNDIDHASISDPRQPSAAYPVWDSPKIVKGSVMPLPVGQR
jgi:hypothetical protein